MNPEFLSSDETLAAFLQHFEAGTWPIADWRHMHHLAVAACYLHEDPHSMDRLRINIKHYNLSQGGQNTEDSGYHETLTRFWVEIITNYLESLPSGLPRLEIVRLVVAKFASRRDLFHTYYDFDVVKSREARQAWIPPSRRLVL